MIKQLKIGKKLLVLVTSLLLCLIIVGGSSLMIMHRIHAVGAYMSSAWLPAIATAEEMNTLASNYRIYELDHILANTSADKQKYTEKRNEIQKKMEEHFTKYESLGNLSEADRELLEEIKKNWNSYTSISDQMLEFSKKNQTDAAKDLLLGESRALLDATSDACLNLMNYNKDGADKANKKNKELFIFSFILVLVILVIAIVSSILLSIIIVRLIVKPINEINDAACEITKGNLDIHIDCDSNDEVGQIARSFTKMSGDLKTIIQDIQYILGEMTQGNFLVNTKCEEKYLGEYRHIILAIRQINRTLSNTLSGISIAADQVASSSDQVSNGAQSLSEGATEQASSIEELSASISDVSTQVKENAENARMANNKAESAGQEIANSNEQMINMVEAMGEIDIRSSEISKIIKVIEDIAFQTNILALNAAVEAARAGSAGKGFAVVADEVRNLASKSAEAAKSTTNLIEETLVAVQNGSNIADHTAKSLNESARITQEAVDLIQKIAEASNVQAQSVSQINIGVEQIASVVQTNSATAEESAATSEELSGQAQILKDLIRKFKLREETSFNNVEESDLAVQKADISESKY